MECMKCGREVEAGQVFCESCLEHMAQYPVKPDVVIQLPNAKDPDSRKNTAPRHRTLSTQEQIQQLTLRNKMLFWFLTVAVVLCCLLAFVVGVLLQEQEESQNMGKNYSTVETIETTPPLTAPPDSVG